MSVNSKIIWYYTASFLTPEQNNIIKKDIFEQLREILEKGQINVYNSDILLMEQISTILYYYSQKLGYDFKLNDFYLPRFELIYPINLKDLRDRIYKFRATHYYKRTNVNSSLIAQMVEEAFKKNIDIPKLNVTGDFPPFEELFKIVNILLKKGYNEIEKYHLPYPDKSIIETKEFYEQDKKQNFDQIRSIQFSEEQAKLYIESFFTHLESCYKEFVEYCFPTLKNEFPFFSTLSHEYFFYMKDSDILKWGWFGSRPSTNNEVKFNFKEYISFNKAFEDNNIAVLKPFSLDDILHNYDYRNLIKTIDGFNTPKVDEFCVIRNWVYRLLKDDMKDIFKENEISI